MSWLAFDYSKILAVTQFSSEHGISGEREAVGILAFGLNFEKNKWKTPLIGTSWEKSPCSQSQDT